MWLEIDGLRFSYGSKPVLENIEMQASPGEITAVIGPNAAGKTTLLKCIARILKPDEGSIVLDGKEMNNFKKEEITKYVSYLPQETSANAVLTVFEAVLLGRLHSLSWRVGDDALTLVSEVLEDLEIEDLASKYLNELSGGQKQMVSIAQSLVREPKVLLMDEPTSSLDLQHQLEVLDLIRDVTVDREITTLIALHDLNLAARYADKIVVLHNGTVYASGKSAPVLTPEMVRHIYGVNATVYVDGDGIPQITPISSVRRKLRANKSNKESKRGDKNEKRKRVERKKNHG
ncbi:MAG: ABC transporter ATP-binding protein [Candidatus Latescibacterota bacterium]|nr:MAG: ABC transporter ATP-binding protein [Candidatus Omnitrophota bacterium]RKY65471.1 MAG: ABC transporter ATP-binding protein [Candidatus Latescibacterota bacterium]